MREGNWKLLVNADGKDLQLYDLKSDPKETTNAVAANSKVAARLKGKALAWRKALPNLRPSTPE
jgi:arylsulfatase A-like enzyme